MFYGVMAVIEKVVITHTPNMGGVAPTKLCGILLHKSIHDNCPQKCKEK
jgi:hypothetical protein